jgi:hypothetical protein
MEFRIDVSFFSFLKVGDISYVLEEDLEGNSNPKYGRVQYSIRIFYLHLVVIVSFSESPIFQEAQKNFYENLFFYEFFFSFFVFFTNCLIFF